MHERRPQLIVSCVMNDSSWWKFFVRMSPVYLPSPSYLSGFTLPSKAHPPSNILIGTTTHLSTFSQSTIEDRHSFPSGESQVCLPNFSESHLSFYLIFLILSKRSVIIVTSWKSLYLNVIPLNRKSIACTSFGHYRQLSEIGFPYNRSVD